MSLTRKELDASGCGMPNCDHNHDELYLHSVCHPTALLEVRYMKVSGELVMSCGTCGKTIAVIEVAK